MKLSLLLSSALITLARAAVQQRCMPFETPRSVDTYLQVEISKLDTSVLIYHLNDLPSTNIPLVIDDILLSEESNGFSVCTQKKLSQGLCEDKALGHFMFKENGVQHEIINTQAHQGQSVRYNVKDGGMYCAIVYQEGVPVIEDVTYTQHHWYGNASLLEWESLKMLFFLDILLIISGFVIYYMFGGNKRGCIGTLLDDVKAIVNIQSLSVALKCFVFAFYLSRGSQNNSVFDAFKAVDQLYSVLSFLLFYKLSIGVFGISREKIHSINMEPKFKALFRAYAFASLITPFYLSMPHVNVYVFSIIAISNVIVNFAWIPMVSTMWRNAKATEKEMVDPVFARNYSLSRKCVVWIPVLFWCTSFFGQVAVVSINSKAAVGASPADVWQSALINSVDTQISQNFWFVLLKHLSSFSMLAIQWAIIVIWKPQMLERTEDIHSHELSDAPFASLHLEEQKDTI